MTETGREACDRCMEGDTEWVFNGDALIRLCHHGQDDATPGLQALIDGGERP